MRAWLTALGLSLLCCWLLAVLAPRLRLLDVPDARKQHEGAVPVVGGLAIMLGFVLSSRLAGIAGNFTPVALPLGLMLALGAWDDAHGMAARTKLIVQIVAVWLLVKLTGLSFAILPLPPPIGPLALGIWAVPFTVLLGVTLLNALNTIDGLDGLCGGLLMIALLLMGGIAAISGDPVTARIALILQASVLGFWLLNARLPWQGRARVFLGDAGAFSVGLMLLWFMLHLGGGTAPRVPWPLLIGVCWLPLADLAAVAVLRLRAGRNPLVADRRHFHHLLLALGFNHATVAIAGWALGALVGATLFLMWRAGMEAGTLLFAQVIAAVVYSSRFHRAWQTRSQT